MYTFKTIIILLLFIFLNINIVFSQSTELRESLKNTKTFYKEGKLNEAVSAALIAIEFSKKDFGKEH